MSGEWHLVHGPGSPRVVGPDGEEILLDGIGQIDMESTGPRDPMTIRLHVLPGMRREAEETRYQLMRRWEGARYTRIELTHEEEEVTFQGGPLHGRTMPLPHSSDRGVDQHFRYIEPDHEYLELFPANRLTPSATMRTREHLYTLTRRAEPRGERWVFLHETQVPSRLDLGRWESGPVCDPAAVLRRDVAAERRAAVIADAVQDALRWRACRGSDGDEHDEVRWQGGAECWMCGKVGEPSHMPHVGEHGY